jgi:hypothetical protein
MATKVVQNPFLVPQNNPYINQNQSNQQRFQIQEREELLDQINSFQRGSNPVRRFTIHEARAQTQICISYLTANCNFPNCRRNHSKLDKLKECRCCKFNILQSCNFGDRCRNQHLTNCDCIEELSRILSPIIPQ